MSATLLLAPSWIFRPSISPWLMYLPKSGCPLPPARLDSDGPLPIAVVYVHTYLIDKIYTLLGTFNDVKNASVRTHVLTGTYFSQIAQHIS